MAVLLLNASNRGITFCYKFVFCGNSRFLCSEGLIANVPHLMFGLGSCYTAQRRGQVFLLMPFTLETHPVYDALLCHFTAIVL